MHSFWDFWLFFPVCLLGSGNLPALAAASNGKVEDISVLKNGASKSDMAKGELVKCARSHKPNVVKNNYGHDAFFGNEFCVLL